MGTINISDIKDKIAYYAQKHGIPANYLEGLLRAENSKDASTAATVNTIRTDAISPKQAKGIMQITPPAIAQGIKDGRLDPSIAYDPNNIDHALDVGAAYAAYGLRRSGGDPIGMASVYNSGRLDANNPETNLYRQKFAAGAGINMPDMSTQYASPGSFASGAGSTADFASALLDPNSPMNAMKSGLLDSYNLEPAIAESHQASQQQGAQAIQQGLTAGMGQADTTAQQGAFQQRLQSTAGFDPNDPNNLYAESLRTSMQAHQDYEGARAKYDEMSQKTFWDDPLGTILASIEMPRQAAIVNNLAAKQDRADQFLQSRISILGNAEQTMKANTVTAQQQVDQATAQAKASAAYAELDRANTGTLVQQADRSLSRAHAVGYMMTAEMQNAIREERLDQLKLKAQEEADMNQQFANVSKVLGYAQPVTVKTFDKLSKPEKTVFMHVMNTGSFGPNLGEAVTNYLGIASPNRGQLAATGGSVAFDTARKISDAMLQHYQKQTTQEMMAAGEKATPQAIIDRTGSKFQETVESSLVPDGTAINDLGAAKWDTHYNPYKLDFMGIMGVLQKTQGQGLGTPISPNNIMYKYLGLRIAQGNLYKGQLGSDDIKGVFSAIEKDIADNKITAKDAARDISTFMQAGQNWQQQLQQLPRLGLKNANGYNYSLPGSQDSIDLINRAQVENALAREVAARRAAAVLHAPFVTLSDIAQSPRVFGQDQAAQFVFGNRPD